jgi:hypothetical protein
VAATVAGSFSYVNPIERVSKLFTAEFAGDAGKTPKKLRFLWKI